jgi:hypothetical protein
VYAPGTGNPARERWSRERPKEKGLSSGVDEQEDAVLQAIRSWPRPGDLATFARERHGYGNSNGGFGVIYPDDLDEHDIQVDGVSIPEGCVEVYGFWGVEAGGWSRVIREDLYLAILARALRAKGLTVDALAVEHLLL